MRQKKERNLVIFYFALALYAVIGFGTLLFLIWEGGNTGSSSKAIYPIAAFWPLSLIVSVIFVAVIIVTIYAEESYAPSDEYYSDTFH